MRAFVTGATGFIGQNLVAHLIDKGWKVSVLSRSKNSKKLFSSEVEVYLGDLGNLNGLKRKIQGVDIVFNLAGALPHHSLPEKDYWETNVQGVKNLLEIFKNSNIKRFVHVSTVGIYGPTNFGLVNEKSPIHLTDVYTKTKAAGENLVFRYFKKYNLPAVVIRPTIAFGPKDIRPGFFNLFPLIKRRLFIPVGKGDNFFHTIYVENLIEALLLAVRNDKAIGEDFIIGDDPCPTMKKIIQSIAFVEGVKLPSFYLPQPLALEIGRFFDIAQKIGIPAILNTRRVNFITENRRFNIDKAKRILGYKPSYDLMTAVQKTYSWYKKEGLI